MHPMYVHHFVYYLIHNEHVACFYLLATTNDAAVYLGLQISLREQSIIILDTYSNVDHVAIIIYFFFLVFWGNSVLFPIMVASFYYLQKVYKGSN